MISVNHPANRWWEQTSPSAWGCYLDIKPNSPVLFTGISVVVSRENYKLGIASLRQQYYQWVACYQLSATCRHPTNRTFRFTLFALCCKCRILYRNFKCVLIHVGLESKNKQNNDNIKTLQVIFSFLLLIVIWVFLDKCISSNLFLSRHS